MLLIVLWTFLGMCDLLGSAHFGFWAVQPKCIEQHWLFNRYSFYTSYLID